MHVLSFEADTAIFLLLELWPNTMAVIAARWFERDLRGENGGYCPFSLADEAENESIPGMDHRWIVESVEPDRAKLEVGSTARHVADCK